MLSGILLANEKTPQKAPVLFCAHGSPMNILANNDYTNMLENLATMIKKPKAIIVISAHWQQDGFCVTSSNKLSTIYDFYGFPDSLYDIRYDALGAVDVANMLHAKLNVKLDATRGIDHGAWSVLRKIFPKKDVPIVQLSLSSKATPYEHYEFGIKLGHIRNEDIMIISSGNLTHNLYLAKPDGIPPEEWALEAELDILNKIVNKEVDALCTPNDSILKFKIAHPTLEHYLPALVALGALGDDKISITKASMQNVSISMSGFVGSGITG